MAGGVSTKPSANPEGRGTGFFITFEGPEGSGKSVQSRALAAFLEARGYGVLWTREPGGTEMGRQVRQVLFEYGDVLDPWAEVFLFLADRAQHVRSLIRPALAQGKVVICDRYTDSTLAYQGYGRGLDVAQLRTLNHLATGGLVPHLTLLLDVDVETGLRRRAGTGGLNSFDARALAFHQRVREGYLRMAAEEPDRWVVIPTEGSVEEVQARIQEVVLARLIRHGT